MCEEIDDLVARLRTVPRCRLQGLFARHSHPKAPLDEPPPVVRSPDRWQEAGDESVLFISDSEDTAWAEWRRKVSASEDLDVVESVRNFGWIALSLDDVIDLCNPAVQDRLGVTDDDLTGEDKTTCRATLAGARRAGVEAIVAPSAARRGGKTIIVLPHARKTVVVVSEHRRVPPRP